MEKVKVDKLFNDHGLWNRELIFEWFNHEVANQILRVPLSRNKPRGRLIWTDNEIGVFTVRSAYYKAQERLTRGRRVDDAARQIWHLVWKAQMAPKNKIFMLRSGLSMDATCCVCSHVSEDLFQVFFLCTFSNKVWMNDEMDTSASDFECWHIFLQRTKQRNKVDLYCTVLWLIWKNRNITFHEQRCVHPNFVCKEAQRMCENFHRVNEKVVTERRDTHVAWQHPQDGFIKIKCGCFFFF